MNYNYMANPLIAKREARKEGAIRWRLVSHISYYTDERFDGWRFVVCRCSDKKYEMEK